MRKSSRMAEGGEAGEERKRWWGGFFMRCGEAKLLKRGGHTRKTATTQEGGREAGGKRGKELLTFPVGSKYSTKPTREEIIQRK